MVRVLWPSSRRCVAKLWRKTWGVMGLVAPVVARRSGRRAGLRSRGRSVGVREGGVSGADGEVAGVLVANAVEVASQGLDETTRKHGAAVLAAFAVAAEELSLIEILPARLERIGGGRCPGGARAMTATGPPTLSTNLRTFRAGQDDGKALGPPGPDHLGHPRQLTTQHTRVRK
jgi:hypothetical protein